MHPKAIKLFIQELPKHLHDISPIELKVYTILSFICPGTLKTRISTYDLGNRCRIKWKAVEDSMILLKKRGLIDCELENNPFIEIEIQLLTYPQDRSFKRKKEKNESNNGTVYDNDFFNKIKRCVKRVIVNDTKHMKNQKSMNKLPLEETPAKTAGDNLAQEIAAKLDDEENLALYQKYCQKYPKDIILQSYRLALNTPLDRIKKSRGALFTYLVLKTVKEKGIQS